jgi:mannose-6-phosphate isomerase-like protein (cupin superfamily)
MGLNARVLAFSACGVLALLAIAGRLASAHSSQAAQAAPAPQLFAANGDVTSLVAKAKSQLKPGQPMVVLPIVQMAPHRANLEYRVSVGPASVHETEAELFYVLEGSGTVVTGGTLKDERRTNPQNLTGSGIQGGDARKVTKGDVILVPEKTPHWYSAIDGTLVLMSIHLLRGH